MTVSALLAVIALILAIVALFVTPRKFELLAGAVICLAIAVLLGAGLTAA